MAEQPYYSRGVNSGPSEGSLPSGRDSGTSGTQEGGSAEGGATGAATDGEGDATALNVSLRRMHDVIPRCVAVLFVMVSRCSCLYFFLVIFRRLVCLFLRHFASFSVSISSSCFVVFVFLHGFGIIFSPVFVRFFFSFSFFFLLLLSFAPFFFPPSSPSSCRPQRRVAIDRRLEMVSWEIPLMHTFATLTACFPATDNRHSVFRRLVFTAFSMSAVGTSAVGFHVVVVPLIVES